VDDAVDDVAAVIAEIADRYVGHDGIVSHVRHTTMLWSVARYPCRSDVIARPSGGGR
jgi:hypothetical protein